MEDPKQKSKSELEKKCFFPVRLCRKNTAEMSILSKKSLSKMHLQGLKRCSVVKNTYYSGQGPGFGSQYPPIG